MQIFSGSSNPELAKKIADLMKAQLGRIDISHFANGETRILVKEDKIEKEVVVVQSLSIPTNEHLIEFCLICDALHRGGATEITAVVPWMGYSKQDKIFLSGEPLSAKVIAQIIQTTKIKKLITFDLHNRAIMGFFDIPIVELSAKSIFLDYYRKSINKNMVVVAPDAGSVKSSSNFARELKLPIAYMDKRRDYLTGKVDVMGMSGEVRGQHVIIVDDLIVTGSTIIEAAKYLKDQGALTISVAATHHLYVDGAQAKLEKSEISEIIVTDTVEVNGVNKKLELLSVAELVVQALQH
jgi:ribose-phosphate pyrophosphokinase